MLCAGTSKETHQGTAQNFLSFSRDKFGPPSKSNRWRFGFILDGDAMSDRFKIEPISFTGTELSNTETKKFRVKELKEYQNGTYKVYLINYGTIDISKSTFETIRDLIESMPEEDKKKYRLETKGPGKRKVNGTYLKQSYIFNVPRGGLYLDASNVDAKVVSELSRSQRLYEAEERIWLPSKTKMPDGVRDTEYTIKRPRITIKPFLKGLILPKQLKPVELTYVRKGLLELKDEGFLLETSEEDELGFLGTSSFQILRY